MDNKLKGITLKFGLVFIFGCMIFAPGLIFADEQARAIMLKNNALRKPATVTNNSTMVIFNGSTKEFKEFMLVQKKYGDQARGKITFTKPVQLGMISWSEPGKSTRQWLTLTGDRFSEIATSDMHAPFMGSHFYYEDLSEHYFSDYEYNYLGEEKINTDPCFKIEARENKNLRVYEKRILYVRKSDYFIVQVDFYEKRGHTKTMSLDKIEVIEGIITARKIIMARTGAEDRTIVYLKEISYNKPIADRLMIPKL